MNTWYAHSDRNKQILNREESHSAQTAWRWVGYDDKTTYPFWWYQQFCRPLLWRQLNATREITSNSGRRPTTASSNRSSEFLPLEYIRRGGDQLF
jgi:hypothetical protein